MSVLDYSSLFMAFSFAGGVFSPPRGCTGLFSWGGGGVVRELHKVHDAGVFHAGSFGVSCREEMISFGMV
jgi:hypothetical protein